MNLRCKIIESYVIYGSIWEAKWSIVSILIHLGILCSRGLCLPTQFLVYFLCAHLLELLIKMPPKCWNRFYLIWYLTQQQAWKDLWTTLLTQWLILLRTALLMSYSPAKALLQVLIPKVHQIGRGQDYRATLTLWQNGLSPYAATLKSLSLVCLPKYSTYFCELYTPMNNTNFYLLYSSDFSVVFTFISSFNLSSDCFIRLVI